MNYSTSEKRYRHNPNIADLGKLHSRTKPYALNFDVTFITLFDALLYKIFSGRIQTELFRKTSP